MLHRILILLTVMLSFSFSATAETNDMKGLAEPWQMGYQEPATPVMEQLIDVHNYTLIIATLITLFVLGLLIYVCVRFRSSRNPDPSKTTHNTILEIAWIVIPILILLTIFFPSLDLHYYMDKTQKADMTLKVTGYQWYWGYSYPDQEIEEYLSYMKTEEEAQKEGQPYLLAVDNPVVVPVDTNVRVLLTAADVIHSFAMPSFGVKTDCIPGRLNETWFRVKEPGIYYGQCSELCGKSHGYMPIEIRAVEQDVFEQWVGRAKEGDYALDGLGIPENSKVATIELQPVNRDTAF